MEKKSRLACMVERRLPIAVVIALLVVALFGLISVSLAAPPGPNTKAPALSLAPRSPAAPLGESTIGDYVWYDYDVDGYWDTDVAEDEWKAGINGVLVNLYIDSNKDGSWEYVASTVTGDDPDTPEPDSGWYEFPATAERLGAWYLVEIDPSNFDPGGPLDGYAFTSEDTIPGTQAGAPYRIWVTLTGDIVEYLDADFGFAKIGLELTKTISNQPDEYVVVSDTVSYEVVIRNAGWITVTKVPLRDYYTPACLGFLGAVPEADEVDTDLGVLYWVDLTESFGRELAPGKAFTVEVSFHAQKTHDMVWKEGGWQDYTPKGMPDFSQKQDRWGAPTQTSPWQWSSCGPVAAANSLWWFDSKFEVESSPPPPTVSNSYPLIPPYGPWDDHDAKNVEPFVNQLATLMHTNPITGTHVSNLYQGIQKYIAQMGLADHYTYTLAPKPEFEWVEEEVRRSEDVILLLGFWQAPISGNPALAERVGGHFVTVAGVDSNDGTIAISDPYRDAAEGIGLGRVMPAPHNDLHPAAGPTVTDTVHNDAKYLSHDLYRAIPTGTPGGIWGLEFYVNLLPNVGCAEIANFQGQNVPPEFLGQPGVCIATDTRRLLWTEVEYAVAVSPVTPTLMCDPTNNIAVVSGAEDEDGNHLPEEQFERKTRVYDPDIAVVKLANNAPDGEVEYILPGETVTYTFLVTNTGDTYLYPVNVVDNIYGPINCPVAGPVAPLASFTCDYVAMGVMGDVTNTVTVTGTPSFESGVPIPIGPVTDTDDAVVDVVDPGIAIVKTAGNAADGAVEWILSGETVTYTYRITNSGDTYLLPVTVFDDKYGTICTIEAPELPLAPDDWFTCSYAASGIDADVTNVVTATGTAATAGGTPLPDIGDVEDDDDAVVELRTARLTISKTLNTAEPVRVGEAISFTIRITNSGDGWIDLLPLTDIYSKTYLTYGYGGEYADPMSVDTVNDGEIHWTDLVTPDGTLLEPGKSATVLITFTAEADTHNVGLPGDETPNVAIVSGALVDLDGPEGLDEPDRPVPTVIATATVEILKPTGLAMASFDAAVQESGMLLRWQTASEAKFLGFNLLRSLAEATGRGGQPAFVRANAGLIPARYAGADQGASYSYLDGRLAAGTYTYILEIVRLDGTIERYGLVTIRLQ